MKSQTERYDEEECVKTQSTINKKVKKKIYRLLKTV